MIKEFWSKYKKRISTALKWSVVVVVLGIVVPIGIDIVYDHPAAIPLFNVAWDAKDALAFYGSLLGAAATIFVLRMTILFTRENQKEERKLSVKPYLQTQMKVIENVDNNFANKGLSFIDIKKGIIKSQESIPSELSDLIILWNRAIKSSKSSINTYDVLYARQATEYFKSRHLILYEIKNCGAGNAISVEFRINDFKSFPNFCVTLNEPQKFVLIFNDELIEEKDFKINLTFVFTDICSLGTYIQTESIVLSKSDNSELFHSRLAENLLTEPKEIQKRGTGNGQA